MQCPRRDDGGLEREMFWVGRSRPSTRRNGIEKTGGGEWMEAFLLI